MRLRYSFSPLFSKFGSAFFSLRRLKNVHRQLMTLTVIASLLLFPTSSQAYQGVVDLTASAFTVTTGPIQFVSSLYRWLFPTKKQRAAVRKSETLADRLARISHITVTPNRYVAYLGQTLTLSAVGFDSANHVVQGAKFSWASSDIEKVQIDQNGNAVFLSPGQVTITCQGGAVQATASLLIKPGTRPVQSDAEWQLDQATVSDTQTTRIGRLMNAISPTVEAQGGSSYTDSAFDELWSEPRNLTGTPSYRVLDSWKLGSVQPEGSNFTMAMPLYGLGGKPDTLLLMKRSSESSYLYASLVHQQTNLSRAGR